MPTVPVVRGPEVSSRGIPAATNSLQFTPNDFGAGVAQAGQQAINVFAEAKGKADLALAQDALLQFQAGADDQYAKLQKLQGKNAIGQGEATVGNIRSIGEELAATLPEGRSRETFIRQSADLGLQYRRQAIGYETGQIRAFEDSRQRGMQTSLGTKAINDPANFATYAELYKQNEIMYNAARGGSDEEAQANFEKWQQDTAWTIGRNEALSNPGQFMRVVGEPSDAGGVTHAPAGAGPARGLRNNNPGNIVQSANTWEGQTGSDGQYATFATPEHGIRALGKNLLSYSRQGYQTIDQIINRWAPPLENNTGAYVSAVSKAMGIPANTPVDLTDPATLTRMATAITQHENGSMPYTQEQIGTGIQAALGITQLPESKRQTGVSWYDGLTPLQQTMLNRQAETAEKQQRAEYRAHFDAEKKNWYSSLDEGLMPSSAAGRQSFIDAYGPVDGLRQWQDFQEQKAYGSIISVAGDMSPTARADILARARPSNPDDPNFAGNQQRWEKMGAKFKEMDKAYEVAQGVARVDSSLQNNFPLDPNDKNNQSAIDAKYDREIAPTFNINSADSLRSVAEITTKTGMIPTKVQTMLTSGARTKDPAVAVPMARMFSNIMENNPAAAAVIDKGDMAFYQKVYAYDSAGVPPEKAVELSYQQVFQQDENTKQMISQQIRDKDYIKTRDKYAQSLVSTMTPGGRFSPNSTGPGVPAQNYLRDYRAVYDANFAQTGGDAEQAKAMTDAMINRVWAVSTVNGSAEIMKYAPEALYGVNNGSGNWIQGQWENEARELKSNAFGGVRGDTDLVLVPDALTSRDQDYAVMVRQKNAEGYNDVRPYYGPNGLPIRFKPDQQTSPMYKAMMGMRDDGVEAARQKRAGANEQPLTNAQQETVDLSKPFGFGSANTLPTNIYSGDQ
ncbi:hypothetical protein [Pectobacterium aroidearum]|uniref:hypothetical protein n=1 Tax=Pectobacterium aroidearum TaxID=1201031 RepID=UPI001CD5DAB1|nr:hypothetical protein [Pectobacterium aroidearum]